MIDNDGDAPDKSFTGRLTHQPGRGTEDYVVPSPDMVIVTIVDDDQRGLTVDAAPGTSEVQTGPVTGVGTATVSHAVSGYGTTTPAATVAVRVEDTSAGVVIDPLELSALEGGVGWRTRCGWRRTRAGP